MSRRVGNTIILEEERPFVCDLCGNVAELRPYGPRGERICFRCATKDRATTERMMGWVLFGEELSETERKEIQP